MILRALHDYYHRCDNLPTFGMELKEIGFIIVIDKNGQFVRFEDRRIDKKSAQQFLVRKSVGRSSAPVANYLYDNSQYVFGYSDKDDMDNMRKYYDTFKEQVLRISTALPDDDSLKALKLFYEHEPSYHVEVMSVDPLWEEVSKNLNKKYSVFSFLIEGDTEIVASKRHIVSLFEGDPDEGTRRLCLVTGQYGKTVETTTATMIPGSQATAKLVAFQVNSGYDSYGKEKGFNAPISEVAEFAYSTALKHLLRSDSHNKFSVGSRTFLFWSSSESEAAKAIEESIFTFFGRTEENDDPNKRIELVRQTFMSIYNGKLSSAKDDRFYILGLAPNSARIAVVYWAELPLQEFAGIFNRHFADMEIADNRKDMKPYAGLHSILGAVSLEGKSSNASPNLPDAVVKSIFQGMPYPESLFQACLRRIRAEQALTITRAAIIKAYLNRLNDNNNKKLNIMLDKENTNQGYLCGRLFAVLDKIQEDANNIHSIRERYMNSASAVPSTVFATILNLSSHHLEKLGTSGQIRFEKLKQEIISKLDAEGFPARLDLQDQGRFFVGYYHQRQDFFTSKHDEAITE